MTISEVGQFLGFISFTLSIIAFYQTKDKRLKVILSLMYAIHSVHFYLLGALLPAVLCILSLVRTFVAVYSSSARIAFIFIVLIIAGSAFSYESVRDLLPLAASIVGTYSLFCLSGIKMRIGILTGASLWLVNNVLVGSIGGTLMELFVISTNLLTMYRLKLAQLVIKKNE